SPTAAGDAFALPCAASTFYTITLYTATPGARWRSFLTRSSCRLPGTHLESVETLIADQDWRRRHLRSKREVPSALRGVAACFLVLRPTQSRPTIVARGRRRPGPGRKTNIPPIWPNLGGPRKDSPAP